MNIRQLPTNGADYTKYDIDHLMTLLKPGILHRNEARFKALIRKELKKREQQGVAEGASDNTAVIYDNGYVKIDGKMYKAKRMNHESGMGIAIQTPSKMYFSPIQNEYEMPSVTIHRALKLGGLNPVFNEGVAEAKEFGEGDIQHWAQESPENKKIYDAYVRINQQAKKAWEEKDGALYTGLQVRRKQLRDLIGKSMFSEQGVAEDWQKVNKSDKTDGMSKKAVKAYRRENPGSKLQTAVTKKPSEIKKGSKDDKRRKSFCARMSGMKGPMKDEHGKPTAKAKALSRWNCEESVEESLRTENPCWKGYKPVGTKKKNGKTVPNCVPKESMAEGWGQDTADRRHEQQQQAWEAMLQKYENDPSRSKYLEYFRNNNWKAEAAENEMLRRIEVMNLVFDKLPSDIVTRYGHDVVFRALRNSIGRTDSQANVGEIIKKTLDKLQKGAKIEVESSSAILSGVKESLGLNYPTTYEEDPSRNGQEPRRPTSIAFENKK